MKKIKYLLGLFVCIFIINMHTVSALGINGNTSVNTGSSIAVSVDAKGLIGQFSVSSSNESVLAGSDSVWLEDEVKTLYFTGKKEGSATITVTATDAADTSGNEFTGSRSITINVVSKANTSNNGGNSKPVEVNKVYDSNNYLSSLSIDGYSIVPEFDKDTLEYTVELDEDVKNIKVSASAASNKANIKGIGEVEVTEGANTIEIVVSAENGNERTYKILANVKDKNPINVKIDKKEYTVIKNKELLGTRDGYKENTIKIDGVEVPSLYNEVTKVNLVGLKNSEGNIELYSYDTKTGKYIEYKEVKFDVMNLYIHSSNDNKYESTNIKVNGKEVEAYKVKDLKDYYLLYATNISTGYEGYYLYDTIDNSVQRYDTTLLDKVTQEKDKYLSIVLVLSSVCFLAILFLLIEINLSNKRKNED